MGNSLTELASYVEPLATQFLADSAAADVPCVIVDTGRTPAEQQVKLSEGVSWTTHSKHEPQPPEWKSEAFDACPQVLLATKLWSPGSPLWLKIGLIGESLGLEWGGRWTHINNGRGDPSHFQYKKVIS